MAGSKDSASRLGVSLIAGGHKYDQIIALTQGNVNESLQYYFDIHPEALTFNVSSGRASAIRASIKGTIKSPTVELIDEDGADKALYCLKLEKGSKYTIHEPEDPDDDDSPMVPKAYDASGWKLAFEVSFGMKDTTNVPDTIKQQIHKPGDYSVQQLIVIFGTADLLRFDWSKSVITLKTNDAVADARTVVKTLIDRWLESTKMRDDPTKHNVLGYAVTTNNPQALEPAAPSFPPTSVRLQTINHRPNGDKSQARTDSDFNGFLFTEMCGNRPMVTTDLPWTGDLFYESIGGTIIIARHIFWNDYIGQQLKPFARTMKMGANELARRFIGDRFGWWVISNDENDRYNNDFQQNDGEMRHTYNTERGFGYEESMMTVRPSSRTEVHTHVFRLNNNSFVFRRWLSLNVTVSTSLEARFLGTIGKAEVKLYVTCLSETVFSMRSVEATGKLDIDVENKPDDIKADVQTAHHGPVITILNTLGLNGLVGMLEGAMGVDDLKNSLRSSLEGGVRDAADVGNQLREVFNNQSKFVFPGGGTFDMKDPLFSNDGDLIMGLVYRK